jgi:hypothetical protein
VPNQFFSEAAMATAFDGATQSFTAGGTPLQTSIYRMFPGSKTTDTVEDDDVVDLNVSMRHYLWLMHRAMFEVITI